MLSPAGNGPPVDTGRLRALVRTDRVLAARHQILVETVLAQMSGRFAAEQFCDIGLVLAELDLVRPVEVDHIGAEPLMVDDDVVAAALEGGFGPIRDPAPGVAEPDLRQHMNRRFVGTAIADGQAQQDVVGARLGIFDIDVEIAVGVEDAGIDDLELGLPPVAPRVLLHQKVVGKFGLRILVEHPGVAVGRHRVEVVVELLDVLAMIALAVAQAEHALLQDRVLAVPQRDGQAQVLLGVAKPADPVLAPAIGAAACLVMRQVVPGVAIGAVVLAHRAPLALAHIGAPFAPGLPARVGFLQALALRGGLRRHGRSSLLPRRRDRRTR